MFVVGEIEADVKRVLGGVGDSEFYSVLNHAVEILSTEANWDPLFGYVDVCVGSDRFVTLPSYVGTILAVNICGKPAQGHDWLYRYHLNGPGTTLPSIGYHWVQSRPVCTYLDPSSSGSVLACQLESSSDTGKNFRVFGYDTSGNWIRSNEDGQLVDGFLVPMNYGTTLPNGDAPAIRQITRISKDETAGYVKLYTVTAVEGEDDELTQIGYYKPEETEPKFRRIQLSKACTWARIAFRKGEVELSNSSDLIPLHSKYAIVLMAKALKKADEDRPEEYMKYKNLAVALLTKKQESVEIPSGPSVQIADQNLIHDKGDRLD